MNRKAILTSLCFFVAYCGNAQPLKIAVASSLNGVMQSIILDWHQNKNVPISLIPAASGTLTHQIINGAPFDIFISADEHYCQVLETNSLSRKTINKPFYGQIVLWSKSELDTNQVTLVYALKEFLKENKRRTIAMANPDLAPYGRVVQDWLDQNDIKANHLITGNSIALTNQYIQTESADLVFTSKSTKVQLDNTVAFGTKSIL